ncbi:general substrate transporter [Mycena rebaudengoi]|nr:general substrate transporter [Mycena rebaudengoi]
MARAIPTNRRAVVMAIFIAFGFYDIGVISGCLIMPDFIERFGGLNAEGNPILSSARQSIITSLLSAGTFVGALGQAFTSDRFGRRGSILIWSGIFTVGVAIQTGTERSIVQLTIGRFVAGLGLGALSGALYNGETAPKALRGTFLVLYQLQIIVGLFLSYVLDLETHAIRGSASWRIPVGIQLVRHLLGNGKTEEASRVISKMNGVPIDDALVVETIEELQFAINEENAGGKATWFECFSTRNSLWKRTMNGMMLQFIQQLNGQNFYYYYGPTFFKSSGTELSPLVIQTVLGAKWGRRRSLLTGAILEAVCAIIPNTEKQFLTSKSNLMIAFAVLHVLSFAIFWGPTPFPLRVRPKSIALGSASNWFWNFMLAFFSPRITDHIGPLILMIFGMLVFGFGYVYLFIPETKGLSLEEVLDEMYRSGVKPWNSAGWTPHLLDRLHENEKDGSLGDGNAKSSV